jgi:HAMP domain-containing protein
MVLAVTTLLAVALGALFVTTQAAHESQHERLSSDRAVNAAYRTLQSVAAMEDGLRAYDLIGRRRYRAALRVHRRAFAAAARELEMLTSSGDAAARRSADQLVAGGTAYIAAERAVSRDGGGSEPAATRRSAVLAAERRVETMRRNFDELLAAETAAAESLMRRNEQDARAARAIGVGTTGASLLLVLAFGLMLRRRVLQPVRALGQAARRLGGGSFGERMPEPRLREFKPSQEAFNAMAAQLDGQRGELLELNAELEGRVEERTAALEAARLEVLSRLARVTEYRDDDTRMHTERVGRTAALVGEAMGLDAGEIRLLRLAAPLHDIGKVGLPDSILLKPGRLTADERAAMQRHTTIGADMLADSQSDVLRMAEQIALTHHERWDGAGYPHALRGTVIPLAARIVAVADVFDALTHERPYKEAWPLSRAVELITHEAGAQFDPDVVAAFLTLDAERLVDDADETVTSAIVRAAS